MDDTRKSESREKRRQRIKDAYQQLSSDDLIYIPAKKEVPVTAQTPRKRVCAYCRVSTDDPAQTTSYELQKEHYEEYISRNPDWEFAGIYADEGISATSLKHRDNFNRMIAAAQAGKIDIIITKAVSRFARNVVDCLSMVRKLAALNPPVAVQFETEGINTLESTSEMILAVMAAAAQEESKTKSNAMNWSLENRFKKGKFLTPVLLGYDHDEEGKLVINPDEATTVKLIYYLYLSGFPISEIADILTQLQRKTKQGNTKWSTSSIRGIMQNERNCGNVLSWKTFTYDFWEHRKRKNKQDKPQVLKVNHHEAIVSHEVFDAAQLKLESDKYAHDGMPLPALSVIDEGILRGYVSVNRMWRGFSDSDYADASNSVYDQPTRFARSRETGGLDLDGYQVVRSSMFSYVDKPSMSIAKGKVKFNTVCMKKFENVEYVELLLNSVDKCIAVRPCDKSNPNAIRWGYLKESKWITSPKSCTGFMSPLYAIMKWSADCGYKILGQYFSDGKDQILFFDLSDPIITRYEKAEVDLDDENNAELPDTEKVFPVPVENQAWGRPVSGEKPVFAVLFTGCHYKNNWEIMRPTKVFKMCSDISADMLSAVASEARNLIEELQAQLA